MAVDRRKLVLVTSILLAAILGCALRRPGVFAGLSAVWLLYALVVLQSSVRLKLDTPARRTFVAEPPCSVRICCRPAWR